MLPRGVEPLIPYGNSVLSAARMPIPPREQVNPIMTEKIQKVKIPLTANRIRDKVLYSDKNNNHLRESAIIRVIRIALEP